MVKKIIWLVFLLVLASFCNAETYTLTDDRENNGLIFENNELTTSEQADIFFTGTEDKEEGFEKPMLYVNNGKIGTCSDSDEDYIEIEVQKEYCIKKEDKHIKIKIIEIEEDWSSVSIDILKEETIEEKPIEAPSPKQGFWTYIIYDVFLLMLIAFTITRIRRYS